MYTSTQVQFPSVYFPRRLISLIGTVTIAVCTLIIIMCCRKWKEQQQLQQQAAAAHNAQLLGEPLPAPPQPRGLVRSKSAEHLSRLDLGRSARALMRQQSGSNESKEGSEVTRRHTPCTLSKRVNCTCASTCACLVVA
jgi:hypothetical protein